MYVFTIFKIYVTRKLVFPYGIFSSLCSVCPMYASCNQFMQCWPYVCKPIKNIFPILQGVTTYYDGQHIHIPSQWRSQMIFLFKISNKICKKNPHIGLAKKMQNGYLIGLAKKKKKLNVTTLFQGSHFTFYCFSHLFSLFPKTLPTFQRIIMRIFFHNF